MLQRLQKKLRPNKSLKKQLMASKTWSQMTLPFLTCSPSPKKLLTARPLNKYFKKPKLKNKELKKEKNKEKLRRLSTLKCWTKKQNLRLRKSLLSRRLLIGLRERCWPNNMRTKWLRMIRKKVKREVLQISKLLPTWKLNRTMLSTSIRALEKWARLLIKLAKKTLRTERRLKLRLLSLKLRQELIQPRLTWFQMQPPVNSSLTLTPLLCTNSLKLLQPRHPPHSD